MSFSDLILAGCMGAFFAYLGIWLWRLIAGVSNWLADKWLRRNGWDEGEQFKPMIDYVPFWCLFIGVEYLEKPKRFNRQI